MIWTSGFKASDCAFTFNDAGIVIFFNAVHLEKILAPNDVTDGGISICLKDEHLQNALPLIVVNFEGLSKVICFKALHSKKALAKITATCDGITTCSSDVHDSKALSFIDCNDFGSTIFFNDEHPKNMYLFNVVKFDGPSNMTCFNAVQL